MIYGRKRTIFLLAGDIAMLVAALFLTLIAAYFPFPEAESVLAHAAAFGWLFGVWILVFFIAGLYDTATLLFRRDIARTVLYAHAVNGIIATLFFYTIPYFGIAPKTNLFIYLAISTLLLLVWRVYGLQIFAVQRPQRAILIGEGGAAEELLAAVRDAPHLALRFAEHVTPQELSGGAAERIAEAVKKKNVRLIVADIRESRVGRALPDLLPLLFRGVRVVDITHAYESAFHRVPLSLIHHHWIFEHISPQSRALYGTLKRAMDIIGAIIAGSLSLAVYPFVIAMLLADDGSGVFSIQKRIGKKGRIIRLIKFRTMLFTDDGKWSAGNENRVTRAGSFLRKTRLDELPQLWNVLCGDISLIGPRPEFPNAVRHYEAAIPYYGLRHIIQPGLSGWAQIHHERHPHHGIDIEETQNKLSYDLYYLKNRSLLLDIEIALKTIKTLLSRSGI